MTGDAAPLPAPRASWIPALLVSAALTWWLGDVWDAQRLAHLAAWVVLGLVVLPLAFSAALAAVAVALLVLLGLLSVPAWLSRRPVGLAGLARDLWRLPRSILLDYWSALRAVQKPWLWGATAGFVGGVALRLSLLGLSPA